MSHITASSVKSRSSEWGKKRIKGKQTTESYLRDVDWFSDDYYSDGSLTSDCFRDLSSNSEWEAPVVSSERSISVVSSERSDPPTTIPSQTVSDEAVMDMAPRFPTPSKPLPMDFSAVPICALRFQPLGKTPSMELPAVRVCALRFQPPPTPPTSELSCHIRTRRVSEDTVARVREEFGESVLRYDIWRFRWMVQVSINEMRSNEDMYTRDVWCRIVIGFIHAGVDFFQCVRCKKRMNMYTMYHFCPEPTSRQLHHTLFHRVLGTLAYRSEDIETEHCKMKGVFRVLKEIFSKSRVEFPLTRFELRRGWKKVFHTVLRPFPSPFILEEFFQIGCIPFTVISLSKAYGDLDTENYREIPLNPKELHQRDWYVPLYSRRGWVAAMMRMYNTLRHDAVYNSLDDLPTDLVNIIWGLAFVDRFEIFSDVLKKCCLSDVEEALKRQETRYPWTEQRSSIVLSQWSEYFDRCGW